MSPQLDPQARALLDVMSAAGTPQPYTLPIEEARERMRAAFVTRGDPIALPHVEDVSLPTPDGPLTMRLYRPAAGVLPIALFLHGGGWILNDLDTHDRLCRLLARRSRCLVASLDYRRAPEHPYPAALEDARRGYRWLLENAERLEADRSRVVLVGESSGATTATCLTLLLRDLGSEMPALQVLAYPVTDLCDRWPSYTERGTGYTLDREFALWSFRNYAPSFNGLEDPYLVPMMASDLKGLPRTFIMTAEFDPLRDEGIAYAQRLAAAGVKVEHVHADDQMHGFLLLDRVVAKAGVLIDRLADAMVDHRSAASAGTASSASP
ncbi:MAG: alpha/beta hydrolase [Solirubrobacteraceae bacterium]